jgi:hypothetical protein
VEGQLVSCGYVFMDGTGEDLNISTDNSVQVGLWCSVGRGVGCLREG